MFAAAGTAGVAELGYTKDGKKTLAVGLSLNSKKKIHNEKKVKSILTGIQLKNHIISKLAPTFPCCYVKKKN
jgi:hypothetical protein